MPDGTISPGQTPNIDLQPSRLGVLAFAVDQVSETALREGLAESAGNLDCRRGNLAAAKAMLQRIASPRVLILDVSGDERPLEGLQALSEIVEPDVRVLVIGDTKDMEFYRVITRSLGVMEYLAKPLSRDLVTRLFGPLVRGQTPHSDELTGGQLVTVTGARGGVGASVIAANLAWHSGTEARRHTMLLDADLHRGTAALLFDVDPGPGLAAALTAPERIDALLAERAALPTADRLHLLASQIDLDQDIACAPGAVRTLLGTLRRRYNAIVADAPFGSSALAQELLRSAQQRVVVLTPTLACIRDTMRLLAMFRAANASQRAILVVNRLGMPGGLTRKQIEETLGNKIDLIIPDLPRLLNAATLLGQPAAQSGELRNAIQRLASDVGLSPIDGGVGGGKPAGSGLLGWLKR